MGRPQNLTQKDADLLGFANYATHYTDVARQRIDPAPLANFALELAKRLTRAYGEERIVGGRPAAVASMRYALDILIKIMDMLGMFVLEEV